MRVARKVLSMLNMTDMDKALVKLAVQAAWAKAEMHPDTSHRWVAVGAVTVGKHTSPGGRKCLLCGCVEVVK